MDCILFSNIAVILVTVGNSVIRHQVTCHQKTQLFVANSKLNNLLEIPKYTQCIRTIPASTVVQIPIKTSLKILFKLIIN